MDKAHKLTDKLISKLQLAVQKMYSKGFKDLRNEIAIEMSKMSIGNNLKPIERYQQAQKYDRFNKTALMVAEKLNAIDKQAVKEVNSMLTETYRLNYESGIDELSVLLAINLRDKPTKVAEEVKETKSPFDELALDDFKDYVQLKRQVIRDFTTSIMNGEDVNKTIKRLAQTTQIKMNDLMRIARTETTRVENQARIDSYKVGEDYGYEMVKQWVAVGDSRTRHAHSLANGQQVALNKPFIVNGEELMMPGDKNGSAGNVINCRCTMKAGIKKK